MMSATRSGRLRGRPQRSQRPESEEISVDLDASNLVTTLNEILRNVITKDGNTSRAYLRAFVKLAPTVILSHHRNDGTLGEWTLLDIFRCVRPLLVDKEAETRAEALRVVRHLVASEGIFDIMSASLIPPLVVKSLDIVLDNKVERLQALRLMRRCATVAPLKFPIEFVNCILAVANDGAIERDNFAKTCVATAAELCIVNPELWIKSGTFMTIVKSVLGNNVSDARATESLVVTLMYLINEPKTRSLINVDLILEYLISPFTDRHFAVFPDDQLGHLEREIKARNALCSVLRSWSGLIYLCSAQSGLTQLVELLRVPDEETQRSIMGFFFDLFCLQAPELGDDFVLALLAADDKTDMRRDWLLYEGFVAAEGLDLFAPTSRSVDLSTCYMGILLQAMVCHKLIGAVAEATIAADNCVSILATILLGELLHLCNRHFPHDASHMCHLLPGLIDATTSPDAHMRLKATQVVNRLAEMERSKSKIAGTPSSLFLDQQLKFAHQTRHSDDELGMAFPAIPNSPASTDSLRRRSRKISSHAPNFTNLYSQSGVFGEKTQYEWDMVKCILRKTGFEDDPQSTNFLLKLVKYFKPTSRLFSTVEAECEQARAASSTFMALTDFLLDKLPFSPFLPDLLEDIGSCLQQIQCKIVPPSSILSASKVTSTLSQMYFLFIGRLTGSAHGMELLKKNKIFQLLAGILTTEPEVSHSTSDETYVKLILSPLNYSKVLEPTRELFEIVVDSKRSEPCKMYCINMLRMLLRCQGPSFARWAIQILVKCLNSEIAAVQHTAYEALSECCEEPANLDVLIEIDPKLNVETDDRAWMLQLRYFSSEFGSHKLKESSVYDTEISRWLNFGCLKYVKWVEDVIYQSVTRHRRGADGRHGRRSGNENKVHRMQPAFCPPHLLGQLTLLRSGIEKITSLQVLQPICETIERGHLDTPVCVLYLKAALWSVGHVCRSADGLKLIEEMNVVPKIVELARSADVLSIRGTAFYCLCLMSVTREGCELLSTLGWEGVRQNASHHGRHGRRSDSMGSCVSFDTVSLGSIAEFRERAGSMRDSISFDASSVSTTNTNEDPSGLTLSTSPFSWSMGDSRKMMNHYTSQADATGYGTLRMLRPTKRNPGTGDADSPEPVTMSSTVSLSMKEETVTMPCVFVGLVLPRHLSSVFNRNFVTAKPKNVEPEARMGPNQLFGQTHNKEICLRCSEASDEELASLWEEMAQSQFKVSNEDRMQARSDMLKYVLNLAAVYPNTNKHIEQLLLSMKQKQPWVFSDLCLFSDLNHLFRIFDLKQPFRKFLQELFMDVDFGELRQRSERILRDRKAITAGHATDTIAEDDEDRSTDVASPQRMKMNNTESFVDDDVFKEFGENLSETRRMQNSAENNGTAIALPDPDDILSEALSEMKIDKSKRDQGVQSEVGADHTDFPNRRRRRKRKSIPHESVA